MDINLTGQIAATLAENLKQPWYIPLINSGAGVVGGLVTGIITLLGVKLTQQYYKKRDEQKREDEKQKERRNAYVQLSIQKKLPQLYMSRYTGFSDLPSKIIMSYPAYLSSGPQYPPEFDAAKVPVRGALVTTS